MEFGKQVVRANVMSYMLKTSFINFSKAKT